MQKQTENVVKLDFQMQSNARARFSIPWSQLRQIALFCQHFPWNVFQSGKQDSRNAQNQGHVLSSLGAQAFSQQGRWSPEVDSALVCERELRWRNGNEKERGNPALEIESYFFEYLKNLEAGYWGEMYHPWTSLTVHMPQKLKLS